METIYFAYGSNMDRGQMSARCPGAVAVGAATLSGYRFIINRRGYATLKAEEGAETPGVLWSIPHEDERSLDRHEGYGIGLYDKCFREVRTFGGACVDALVYIDHRKVTLGSPKSGYLERIIAAAEEHKLPGSHVAMLRHWPRRSDFALFNRFIDRMKTDSDCPECIRPFGREVANILKSFQTDIFLLALDQFGSDRLHGELASVVLGVAFEEGKEHAETLRLEHAGGLFLLGASLRRFIAHLDQMTVKPILLADRHGMAYNEIAGEGVIITRDPDRVHADDDRLLVTSHAPLVARLWGAVFEGDHGVHPRDGMFLDAVAEAVERHGDSDAPALFRHILLALREQAQGRAQEIQNQLDGLPRTR